MIFSPEQQNERLKWCFDGTKSGAWGDEPDGDHDVVCLRAADFDGVSGRLNDGSRTIRAVDPATFAKVSLQPGDLVIEKSGGGEKQLVGRAVLFNGAEPSVCSNFLARARPSARADSAYLNYLLLAIYNARGTWPHIKQSTGIQNLDMASYLNTRVSIPSLATQSRIAQFLDRKTAQIDALIQKKRELLDRLAEKRQALITHAVIKGLDPNAPTKDSGIDWLGEIPAHWGLVPFKWRCRVQSGQVDPTDPHYADMTLVAPDHIESGTGRLFEATSAEEQGAISGKYFCPKGSVLYSKIRPSLRKVALFDGECLCSADMYAINPGPAFDRHYLFYFLLTDAFTSYAELESMRVAMPKINREALGSFFLPAPDLKEQRDISSHCYRLDMEIRETVDRILHSVEQLIEYRAALITSAVTGRMEGLR